MMWCANDQMENIDITLDQQEEDDENVSVSDESPEETWITINDLHTIQINATQKNVDPETGDGPLESANTKIWS